MTPFRSSRHEKAILAPRDALYRRSVLDTPSGLDVEAQIITLLNQVARRCFVQRSIVFRNHGGRREGAGRKRAPGNVGLQPHSARPELVARFPVHATMRAVRGVPSLRAELLANVVVAEMRRASAKGFRVLHYSVQDNHVHLIAEGDDGASFSHGMQRLASRIARFVNLLTSRRGRFWRERYHRRDLATPRQFRNALVYVVFNFRKHARAAERAARARSIDDWSSAIWIDAWSTGAMRQLVRDHRPRAGPCPTAKPDSWIARAGWKLHGPLDPRESPRLPG